MYATSVDLKPRRYSRNGFNWLWSSCEATCFWCPSNISLHPVVPDMQANKDSSYSSAYTARETALCKGLRLKNSTFSGAACKAFTVRLQSSLWFVAVLSNQIVKQYRSAIAGRTECKRRSLLKKMARPSSGAITTSACKKGCNTSSPPSPSFQSGFKYTKHVMPRLLGGPELS